MAVRHFHGPFESGPESLYTNVSKDGLIFAGVTIGVHVGAHISYSQTK